MADGESCHVTPPVDLAVLWKRASTEAGISGEGWFILENADCWAFRSNEFSNESYAVCLGRLQAQVPKLRALVAALLVDSGNSDHGPFFTTAASLEKVHAIWRI